MNKAFIIGRLTKAPELKQTQSGKTVATLNVAVNRRFNRDTTDFFTVVVWGQSADNCAKYLVKGQQVAVCGEIQTRSYEKDGQKRYVTEIVADEVEFLAKPGGDREKLPDNEIFAAGMEEIMSDEELPW